MLSPFSYTIGKSEPEFPKYVEGQDPARCCEMSREDQHASTGSELTLSRTSASTPSVANQVLSVDELALSIFSYMRPTEMMNIRQTCSHWMRIVDTEIPVQKLTHLVPDFRNSSAIRPLRSFPGGYAYMTEDTCPRLVIRVSKYTFRPNQKLTSVWRDMYITQPPIQSVEDHTHDYVRIFVESGITLGHLFDHLQAKRDNGMEFCTSRLDICEQDAGARSGEDCPRYIRGEYYGDMVINETFDQYFMHLH